MKRNGQQRVIGCTAGGDVVQVSGGTAGQVVAGVQAGGDIIQDGRGGGGFTAGQPVRYWSHDPSGWSDAEFCGYMPDGEPNPDGIVWLRNGELGVFPVAGRWVRPR